MMAALVLQSSFSSSVAEFVETSELPRRTGGKTKRTTYFRGMKAISVRRCREVYRSFTPSYEKRRGRIRLTEQKLRLQKNAPRAQKHRPQLKQTPRGLGFCSTKSLKFSKSVLFEEHNLLIKNLRVENHRSSQAEQKPDQHRGPAP